LNEYSKTPQLGPKNKRWQHVASEYLYATSKGGGTKRREVKRQSNLLSCSLSAVTSCKINVEIRHAWTK